MRSPAHVHVEIKPSRQAEIVVGVTCAATAALVAWLPLPPSPRAMVVVLIGCHSLLALRSWATRSLSSSLLAVEVAADRRTAMTTRDGLRTEGRVMPETYVGESLTSIVWRPDGARRSRAVALLPDMMQRDDLRRLRVVLRYSQASGDASPRQNHAAS